MTPLQKTIRSISLSALFLIPLFALFPTPVWPLNFPDTLFFPFITGKAFYFRILVEIAFAGWAILAFWDARYRPRWSPLAIGVTVFAGVALVADLIGVNPLRSIWSNFERMEGWIVIVHLWAFFMASVHMFGSGDDGRRLWHRWFGVSLGVASITAIYGFAQLFGWTDIHQGSTRLDASLGNAAYFAVYMLMHAGIAAYMFLVARERRLAKTGSGGIAWVYLALTAVFGFLVFQTQTRGTILGVIGGVLLALALYAIFARPRAARSPEGAKAKQGPKVAAEIAVDVQNVRRWRLICAGIIGLMIVLGIVFWTNRTSSFVQSSPVFQRIASISWRETSSQARAYVWPMAIKGAMERPLFGWGQENFNYIFNGNYDPRMYNQEQWFDRAHSVYLDWLVASGFVGLAAYLALYVLFLTVLWRRSSLSIAEKSALTGLIAGYAVHNIFVFDNLASYISFFALLGFVGSIGFGDRGGNARDVDGRAVPASRTFSDETMAYLIMPVALIALVSAIYFINIRPIQANTRLIDALYSCGDPAHADPAYFERALSVDSYLANQEIREQMLSCAGSVIASPAVSLEVKQDIFVATIGAIDAQIAATPEDARIFVLAGSFMYGVGQTEQATILLEKALELSPRKQSIIFLLSSAYFNVDKGDQAVALLKQAYESEPSYTSAKEAYAIGLIFVSKESDARALFQDDPAAFDVPRIAQAYAAIGQTQKAIAIYQAIAERNPDSAEEVRGIIEELRKGR